MGAFFEIQDTIQRITEAIASVIGISADDPAVCCPMIGSWYLSTNRLRITKV